MFKIMAGIFVIVVGWVVGGQPNYVWDIGDLCYCLAYLTIGCGLDSIFHKKK